MVVLVSACGSGGGDDEEADSPRQPEAALLRTSEAGPALAGDLPDGFAAAALTAGNDTQGWGDPETGSDEPFLVLAPEGEAPTPTNAVVVSLAGTPDEGNLADLAAGGDGAQAVTVAGDVASLTPRTGPGGVAGSGDDDPVWTELVAPVVDGVATRITAPVDALSTEELVDLAGTVTPGRDRVENPGPFEPTSEERRTDTTRPGLTERPPGFEPVGGADAIAVMAALPTTARPELASLSGSYRTTYARDDEVLAVTTLPGVALDPWALATGLTRFQQPPADDVELASLADQPAAWVGRDVGVADEGRSGSGGIARTLVTVTPWGDAVLVASRNPDGNPLRQTELGEVATGLEQATLDQWKAAIEGDELSSDPGATELARGTADDGTGWLVQATGPPAETEYSVITEDGQRLSSPRGSSRSLGPLGRGTEPGEQRSPGSAVTHGFTGPFGQPGIFPESDEPEDPFPTISVVELIAAPEASVVIQRPDCSTEPVEILEDLGIVASESEGGLAGEPARVAVAVGPRSLGDDTCPTPTDTDFGAESCSSGLWVLDADGTRVACL